MEFKNPQAGAGTSFAAASAFVGGFVLICFALLLLHAFVWLQVIQHGYYKTRAEENRISLVPITPNRGLIIDRNGIVLARNYSAYTIEITPSKAWKISTTQLMSCPKSSPCRSQGSEALQENV